MLPVFRMEVPQKLIWVVFEFFTEKLKWNRVRNSFGLKKKDEVLTSDEFLPRLLHLFLLNSVIQSSNFYKLTYIYFKLLEEKKGEERRRRKLFVGMHGKENSFR